MKMIKRVALVAIGSLPVLASASGSPYDAISAAADFSDALTAVGAVAAVLGAAYVVIKGFKMALAFLR